MEVLAILFIIGAHGFKPAAAFVPLIVGWTVLLLAAIECACRVEGRLGTAINRLFKPTQGLGPALAEARQGGRWWPSVGWCCWSAPSSPSACCLPACAIFIFVAMRFGAGVSWMASLVSGVATALAIWLIFAMLLRLSLPAGLLFDGGN